MAEDVALKTTPADITADVQLVTIYDIISHEQRLNSYVSHPFTVVLTLRCCQQKTRKVVSQRVNRGKQGSCSLVLIEGEGSAEKLDSSSTHIWCHCGVIRERLCFIDELAPCNDRGRFVYPS